MKIHDIIEGKSENRELWDRIKSKGVVPSIDRERYTDMSGEGLEGPFRMKNGQVLYYDPKEGKYYNRDTDMYVDYDDYRAMNEEDNKNVGAQIADLIRKKNSESSPVARKNIDSQIAQLKRQRDKTNEEDAYDKDVKSSGKPHDKEAAAKRAKAAALVAAKKAKEQGVAEGSLNEFAPGDGGDGGEEDTLRKFAKMWYNGDLGTQQQIEKLLARSGWEIGELESEEGGAFVVQSGDEHGNSYIGFTADDLTEGVEEGDKRPAYVVKASDKPKKVKPSMGGSSAHPYQGKLVGEAEVGNTEYQWAHGKKPSGQGSWFFVAHRGGIDFRKDVEDQDYIQLHGMSFGDAKKAAIKWAKSKGHPSLFVAT